jgi:hypothetical protein
MALEYVLCCHEEERSLCKAFLHETFGVEALEGPIGEDGQDEALQEALLLCYDDVLAMRQQLQGEGDKVRLCSVTTVEEYLTERGQWGGY